jgi:hypothetical protein
MSADYHSATPHVLDFTKYPGIDEQRRFVQTYLSSSGKQDAPWHRWPDERKGKIMHFGTE